MQNHYIHISKHGDDVVIRGEARFIVSHDGRDSASRSVFSEWDWDGSRLRVGNCRNGIYPLYYFATGNDVCVSTSLVRLLAEGAAQQLDASAIAFFLRAGHFAGDDTPFEAIRILPPAGCLEWRRDGWWRVSGGPAAILPQHLSRDEAIDAFAETFRDAVRRRPPHGDFAIPLSGGRDSRHIFFELCDAGWRPKRCVTVRTFPPQRNHEDARIAPILAGVLGVEHVVLGRSASRVRAELRKNIITSFGTDWQAWFLPIVEHLQGRVTDVYSGYGGDTLARGAPQDKGRMELWQAGRLDELATHVLTKRRDTERALESVLERTAYDTFSLERAHARLVEELQRHADQPNPDLAFVFHNALRRRTAPQWFPTCSDFANIYTPYLDDAVYDLLASLPLSLSLDIDFHTDVIARRFPQHKDMPYQDRQAGWGDNDRAYFKQFANELTAYALSRGTSEIVSIRRFTERLAACRRSGDGTLIEWLSPVRLLSLLQLEEVMKTPDAVFERVCMSSERPSGAHHHPRLADREADAEDVAREFMALIPAGQPFVLVDEGYLDIDPLLEGRECLRFGQKWVPPSEDELVRQFEMFRRRGAAFIVFAWPALRWLKHYPTLNHRVQAASAGVHAGDGYVAFQLRPRAPDTEDALGGPGAASERVGVQPAVSQQADRDLAREVPALKNEIESLRSECFRTRWLLSAGEIVRREVPVDAILLVVSKGDDTLLRLDGRIGWHFPQSADGSYAGHPVDSGEAVRQLEMLRAKGGQYLLFPAWAAWWLDYYEEFRRHVEARYERVWTDEHCIVYDLRSSEGH